MAITFYIPGPLRQHTGGLHKVEIDVSGSTVAEALAALWQVYPGLRDRILTEQGEVRQHVNVFVGDENIRYCGGLAASVNASSITLVPAVSGGSTAHRAKMLVL
jgi:molybdopterin synthase sulfur carrier subunit